MATSVKVICYKIKKEQFLLSILLLSTKYIKENIKGFLLMTLNPEFLTILFYILIRYFFKMYNDLSLIKEIIKQSV